MKKSNGLICVVLEIENPREDRAKTTVRSAFLPLFILRQAFSRVVMPVSGSPLSASPPSQGMVPTLSRQTVKPDFFFAAFAHLFDLLEDRKLVDSRE
jgi:hypothetical protein